MKIELLIDGETKVFTTPFAPMLAKRKYLEIESGLEGTKRGYTLEEFDELCMILVDVVFNNKFTFEQLISGASEKYVTNKLLEACLGIKPKSELNEEPNEGEEGNETGE